MIWCDLEAYWAYISIYIEWLRFVFNEKKTAGTLLPQILYFIHAFQLLNKFSAIYNIMWLRQCWSSLDLKLFSVISDLIQIHPARCHVSLTLFINIASNYVWLHILNCLIACVMCRNFEIACFEICIVCEPATTSGPLHRYTTISGMRWRFSGARWWLEHIMIMYYTGPGTTFIFLYQAFSFICYLIITYYSLIISFISNILFYFYFILTYCSLFIIIFNNVDGPDHFNG